jgi:hypothetical protein
MKKTKLRHDTIDLKKSKQNDRIIRRTWWIERIVDFLTDSVLVLPFPLISGIVFFDQVEGGDHVVGASIFFGISLILGGLLLYSLIKGDNLKRIEGALKNHNRQIIKELSEKHGWNLQVHSQQLSVLSPSWSLGLMYWGRQLVVIYDRQDILINVTSYGIHDMKSPFHWFGNRKIERTVKDLFENEIKNDTSSKT